MVSVIALQEQLDDLGKMKGFAKDEKSRHNTCSSLMYLHGTCILQL